MVTSLTLSLKNSMQRHAAVGVEREAGAGPKIMAVEWSGYTQNRNRYGIFYDTGMPFENLPPLYTMLLGMPSMLLHVVTNRIKLFYITSHIKSCGIVNILAFERNCTRLVWLPTCRIIKTMGIHMVLFNLTHKATKVCLGVWCWERLMSQFPARMSRVVVRLCVNFKRPVVLLHVKLCARVRCSVACGTDKMCFFRKIWLMKAWIIGLKLFHQNPIWFWHLLQSVS